MSEILTGSLEDYLEAIYHLVKRDSEARATQLADMLKVKKSSVTVALRALAGKKLIHYSPYSNVTLTPLGEKTAQDIVRRHETLKDFLTQVLGVDPRKAEDSACKMEHVLSKDITDKLNRFMEFITVCPRSGRSWIRQFHQFCEDRRETENCLDCIREMRQKVKQRGAAADDPHLLSDLSLLKPGEKAEIVRVTHRDSFRKRILEMGVTKGAVLDVERIAPLGDPIDIKIRGYHLSLRKEEAKNIEVKIVKG